MLTVAEYCLLMIAITPNKISDVGKPSIKHAWLVLFLGICAVSTIVGFLAADFV